MPEKIFKKEIPSSTVGFRKSRVPRVGASKGKKKAESDFGTRPREDIRKIEPAQEGRA